MAALGVAPRLLRHHQSRSSLASMDRTLSRAQRGQVQLRRPPSVSSTQVSGGSPSVASDVRPQRWQVTGGRVTPHFSAPRPQRQATTPRPPRNRDREVRWCGLPPTAGGRGTGRPGQASSRPGRPSSRPGQPSSRPGQASPAHGRRGRRDRSSRPVGTQPPTARPADARSVLPGERSRPPTGASAGPERGAGTAGAELPAPRAPAFVLGQVLHTSCASLSLLSLRLLNSPRRRVASGQTRRAQRPDHPPAGRRSSHAATSFLRGRPRGRLRGITVP